MKLLVPSLLSVAMLGACAVTPPALVANSTIAARSGSSVSGNVSLSEINGGLRINAQLSGLTPGEHGFHIHEVGDCSAPDASSAKGHFNPANKSHGHHDSDNHHGGDMPNLLANAQGEARLTADLKGLMLKDVIGRSFVVHADPDDYKSQPAGNSGKRVACGVIATS